MSGHGDGPSSRPGGGADRALHDETTAFFTGLDGGGQFREDRWDRPGGGGGVARVLTEGATFEKAGINRSVVNGVLPPAAAQRLGARVTADETNCSSTPPA